MSKNQTESKPQRHWRRRLFVAASVVLMVLLLIAVFAPKLAASGPGRRLLLAMVNRLMDADVGVEDLELSWLAGQHLSGLSVVDQAGAPLLEVSAIDAPQLSLWSLLRGNRQLGQITIHEPVGKLDELLASFRAQPTNGRRRSSSSRSPREDSPLALQLRVVDGQLSYGAQGFERVEVEIPSAAVDLREDQSLSLQLEGSTRRGAQAGRFSIDLDVEAGSHFQLLSAQIDVAVKIDALPTSLFNLLTARDAALEAILGKTISARIDGRGKLDTQFEAKLEVHSERLRVDGQIVCRDGMLTVKAPTHANLKVAEDALAAIWELSKVKLLTPFEVQVSFDELVLPVDRHQWGRGRARVDASLRTTEFVAELPGAGRVRFGGCEVLLSGSLREQLSLSLQTTTEQNGQVGQLDLSASISDLYDDDRGLNLRGAAIQIDGKLADLPTALLSRFVPQVETLDEMVGPVVSAKVSVHKRADERRLVSEVALSSRDLQGQLDTTLDLAQRQITNTTGTVTWMLRPPLLERLKRDWGGALPAALQDIRLAADAKAVLSIEALELPVNRSAAKEPWGRFRLHIDRLAPRAAGLPPDTSIHDLQLEVLMASPTAVEFEAAVNLTEAGHRGRLRVAGKVTDPLQPKRLVDVTITAEQLLFQWLQRVLPNQQEVLTRLVAADDDRIELRVRNDERDPGKWHLLARAHGAPLNALVSAEYDSDGRLTIAEKTFVELNVSEPSAAASGATEAPAWVLRRPLTMRLSIPRGRFFLQKNDAGTLKLGPIDLQESELEARLEARDIDVQCRDRRIAVDSFQLDLRAAGLSKPIEVAIRIALGIGKPLIAKAQSSTSISMRSEGPNSLELHTNSRAEIPTPMLEMAFGQKHLAAILGPLVNLSVSGPVYLDRPSPLDITVEAAKGRAELATSLGQVVKLRRDGVLQLVVTPELSALVLMKLNPVISAVSSERPVKMRLLAQQFGMPLKDAGIGALTGEFELDLGTLVLDRSRRFGGQALGLVMDLLSKWVRLDRTRGASQFQAVFTPMKFQIENGVVSYRQMTMDLEGVVMGFRGSVDIVNDRVQLIMSLSGKTFANDKSIGKYIRPEDWIDVPMTGRIGSMEIDTAELSSGLIRLAAQRGLAHEIGDARAKLIGDFLGQILGGSGRQQTDAAEDEKSEVSSDPLQGLFRDLLGGGEKRREKKGESKSKRREKPSAAE